MGLIKKDSGEPLKSTIEKVIESNYKLIKSSSEFEFDWEVENENEVYKIYLLDKEEEILGLMSLMDFPSEDRIHLNLIEVGASNRGKEKQIDHIAGCLIAFACQLAFIRGYFGFVSLQPKTKLISLYENKYGFQRYGRLLAVDQEASKKLINTYLKDEKE